MKKVLLFAAVSLAAMTACGPQALKMPVMGSRTVMDVDVEELSGLCLTLDKTALLSCGDQGVVKQISFDGAVTDVWAHDADMEDIPLIRILVICTWRSKVRRRCIGLMLLITKSIHL